MENNDVFAQKNELRKKIRKLKLEFSEEDQRKESERIFAAIEQTEEFLKAKTVLMYWSLPGEVQTHAAVLRFSESKKVLLPVVAGDVLELREFTSPDKLSSGNSLGIGEPEGIAFTDYASIDLVIVPGVAFDRHNNRMGRGKAYYDKLLKEVTAYKMGVCYRFQLFDEIPHDDRDVKMDRVIWQSESENEDGE